MNTPLYIKNFRIFDNQGANVEIKPLTFLTGCNSSGKSSITKGILLLDSFLKNIKRDFENGERVTLDKYTLDFTIYPNNTLGRFGKVLNYSSAESEDKSITFEYTHYSIMLSKDMTVRMSFVSDNTPLDNGVLNSLTISIDGEQLFHTDKNGLCEVNMNIIKNDFFDFALGEQFLHADLSLWQIDEIEGRDVTKERKEIEETLKDLSEDRKNDIRFHVAFSKIKRLIENDTVLNAMDKAVDNKEIFYIPVLDKLLSSANKENFETIVRDNHLIKDDKTDDFFLKKINEDFQKSEFETFGDYFNHYKAQFLGKTRCGGNYFALASASLFDIDDLQLKQEYKLQYQLHHSKPIRTFVFENDETIERKKNTTRSIVSDSNVSFSMLYEIMMDMNDIYTSGAESEHYIKYNSYYNRSYSHYAFKVLTQFVYNIIIDSLMPTWCGSVSYFSPSKIEVKRLYSLEENNDFSKRLKEYLMPSYCMKWNAIKGKFIEKWIQSDEIEIYDLEKFEVALEETLKNAPKKIKNGKIITQKADTEDLKSSFIITKSKGFGIGDHISIENDEEGLGVYIRLHKDENDEKGHLLADEGYGISFLVSIMLDIECGIRRRMEEEEKINKKVYAPYTYTIRKETTLVIEEPESHLHPKFQSLLADMMFDAYINHGINFVVETHSEYLIRKLQVLYSKLSEEDKGEMNPISIVYVPKDAKPYQMEMRADGKFKNEFGTGFFDEADGLAMSLMGIKLV